MAKLKLWVRNLIIILATIICLAGVGVGVYFICKPTDTPPSEKLTPEQKAYIEAIGQTEQPDIAISHYGGLALEDGTSVDAGDIIHSFGNYVVIENKTTGVPEFFVLANNESTSSAPSSANNPNSALMVTETANARYVTLKKVDIKSKYSHIYMLNSQYATFGDYAIVSDSLPQPNIWVVSLKTGETVLENDQINFRHLTSDSQELDQTYVGSCFIGVSWASDNFLMVIRQDIVESTTALADDTTDSQIAIESKYILYPLDNVDKKLEFDANEPLLGSKMVGDYLYLLTTKNTYVYSSQLSQSGELQSVLTLANSFVSTTEADSQVTIDGLGYFEDVVYYDIQVLDDTKLLVEKRETKSTWETNEYGDIEGYSMVRYLSDYFDLHRVGLNYLVYDVANQTYVSDVPALYGKIEVLDSFVDGYFVLNSSYQTTPGVSAYSIANIYDSNFTFVLSYSAERYGTIVAYNGENFITSGEGGSTIISPWGDDESHHAGYNIVSTSICDDYVVVKSDKYYSLYNTKTGYVHSDTYLFISQIMNGKVLAYKEYTGYCIMNLASDEKEITPIYNFDTTSINEQYGINLYFASVGFYFTYFNNTYTYVGFDGTTYSNISTYSYKVIDGNVYLSLQFKNGDKKLIISKMLGEMGTLSAEDIQSDYLNNLTTPATQTMAVDDSNFNQTIIGGGDSGGSSSGGSSSSGGAISASLKMDGVAQITATINNDKNVPTYSLNLMSDVLYGNVSDSDEGSNVMTYNSEGAKPWTNTMYNDDFGIGIFKGSVGYQYKDAHKLYGYNDGYGADKDGTNNYAYRSSANLRNYLNYYFIKYYGTEVPIPSSSTIENKYLSAGDFHGRYYLGGAIMITTPYYFVIIARYDILVGEGYDNVYAMCLTMVGFPKGESGFISKASLNYMRYYNGITSAYGMECLPIGDPNTHYSTTLADIDAGNTYALPIWTMGHTGAGSILTGQTYTKALLQNYIIQQYAWLDEDDGTIYIPEDYGYALDWGSDGYVAQRQDKIQMTLTFTTYMSTFTRKMRDITGIENEDYTYSDSLSKLIITASEDGNNANKGYSNEFKIKLTGDAFSVTSFHYNWSSKSGNFFWSDISDTKSSSSDKIDDNSLTVSVLNYNDLYLDGVASRRYYRVMDITNISITYKTNYASNIHVYGADAENADGTGKDGFAMLFYYSNDVNIKYGAIHDKAELDFYNDYVIDEGKIVQKTTTSESDVTYYIGSPRPNLSYFTYNCTFGYKLEGLKLDSGSKLYVNAVGEHISRQSFLTLCGLDHAQQHILKPSQTALTFDIKYNYLNPGDDSTLTSCTNSVGSSASEGTTGAYEFGSTLSANGTKLPTFKDYDAYDTDSSDNVLQTPKGWTFIGWAVGYGEKSAMMYNATADKHYTNIKAPTSATMMQLTGGSTFASAVWTLQMLENDKDSYNVLKYLPYTGNDMTINSSAIIYSNNLQTLNLTAMYAPKQYNFVVDVAKDTTNWDTNCTLYVDNGNDDKTKWDEYKNGQWSTTVYYNATLTIPKMYVKKQVGSNVYYYDVVLYKDDKTIMQTLDSDSSVKYTVHVNTTDLTDVLQYGEDFYKYDVNKSTKNSVYFRAGLRAVEFGTTVSGSQDSHVYGDVDGDLDTDYLHENQLFVDEINVSGQINKVQDETKYYGTASSGEVKIYEKNDESKNVKSELDFSNPFSFLSGQCYTLKFSNISYNYRVKVEFTSGVQDNERKHTYYWNWAEEKQSNKYNYSGSNLELELDPVSGGVYGEENKVELEITIETAFFESTVIVKEDNKDETEEMESQDIGDISISDKVNNQYHESSNKKDELKKTESDSTIYYIGAGTTILLKCTSNDMDSIIHGMNLSVNNSYLSGLKVLYNDNTELFSFNANEANKDSTIATATLNLAQNPKNSGTLLFNSNGFANVEYNGTILFSNGYMRDNVSTDQLGGTRSFIQLLYGLDDTEISNLAGAIYYTIIDVSIDDSECYLIITNHVADGESSGKYYGMKACFVYNVGNNEKNVKDGKTQYNKYTFKISYTKINSTLTFDSTLNGEQQTSDDNKRYLTNTDSSAGGDVVKSDGNGKDYIQIFGRKVYVNVVDNKLQVVDNTGNVLNNTDGGTLSDDYKYLFDKTTGILRNNIDEDGYLFVYVNKSSVTYLTDSKGKIISEKQNNKDSITENNITYIWNGVGYVYLGQNSTTGLYWNSEDSWFREAKDESDSVNIGENDTNNEYNFASVKPSNRFKFDIIASKGQIAKTITIYYNSTTKYIISLSGINIDNGETKLTPTYSVGKYTYNSDSNGWNSVTDWSISKSNSNIELEHMLLYIVTSGDLQSENEKTVGFKLNSISLSEQSTLLASIDIALISASAHISVDFVDYSMVVAGGNEDVGDFGYALDAGNKKIINIVDNTANHNTITAIEFGTDLELNKNLFVSRKNNKTNIEQNDCAEEKIYFMVLGGATGAQVKSTFSEKAVYTVSVSGTNATTENPTRTFDNTAEWGDFDDYKTSTQMTIKNASGANWIASFIIDTKTFDSIITSDIEFGYDKESNVLEETLQDNLQNGGNTLDSEDLLYETGEGQVASGGTKFNANMGANFAGLQDWDYANLAVWDGTGYKYTYRESVYYLKDSNGNKLNRQNNKNYLPTSYIYNEKIYDLRDENNEILKVVNYGAKTNLRGNIITYTIATQYGYKWEGATLALKVGINSSKMSEFTGLAVAIGETKSTNYSVALYKVDKGGKISKIDTNEASNAGAVILSESEESYYLLITLENLTSANSGDIVVSYGNDKTMKIGSIAWGTSESLPPLTLTLERASINEINLDLHYDAKEFEVTYDTSSNFGTSPVGLSDYSETDISNQKRIFTYNLKQNLDAGWGDSLTYTRIGYDQLGWAYDKFYKKDDGTTNNTTELTLTTGNYQGQLYDKSAQSLDWYISLGKDYAHAFGTDNSAEIGAISMYTIWNAKTYSLVLDYNDYTPENDSTTENGSTTSTKYTVTWVFDMPITSADIASDYISFADTNCTSENTLTNAISRVYRLGYTFNGWYYKNGEFNGTTGWTHDETSYANGTAGYNGLVYLAHNDNILTNNDNSFKLALTSTDGKDLGYETKKLTNVFGYSVYQAINGAGSWSEGEGNINLYASWTANTYGFIYDLNGDNTVNGYTDNGYKSLNYNGNISDNLSAGVGSSNATLAFGNTNGVVNVQFDENIGATISAYAYRKGYKFTGWYFSRETDSQIAEESEFNQDLLLQLIGTSDELFAIRQKIKQNFTTGTTYTYVGDSYKLGSVNLIETLGTTGVSNGVSENKDVANLSGNAILLHAQWKELPYITNIDLNNWNMPDYGKNDSEYIAKDEQYTNNVVSENIIQLEICFDTQFNTLNLYVNNDKVVKNGDKFETTITRNGKDYTISGDTAYDVLLQILTAYGYTLGNGEYDFAIYGNGTGGLSTININADTKFDVNLYNQLIYFADEKQNGEINNANSTGGINDGTLSTSGAQLQSIDYSGNEDKVGDWHDYKDDDINNASKVGYRKFTLFALWTIKDIYLDNIGTKEQYVNALDTNETNQTLFIKDSAGNGNKQFYNESTYFKNTSDALGNIGSMVDGYTNNYYKDNTYYLSPATGQYFSSLTIWFNDNYLINSKYSNQTRGKLTLTFEWNKVNRKLTITSATLEIGGMNSENFVPTYTATNTATEGLRPVISDDGQNVTISGEALYCFVGGIEISVSKYMLVTDVSEMNINTEYKNSEWIDRNIPTWLKNAGIKDVHYLTISITGQKSNLVFDGTTMGQTFDVDYYRFVRPSDGMQTYIDQTYIDNTTKSDTFGEEIWDSEFVNDWSMYEVYKTTTYRYGEYVSTAYSYATNFAFGGWYFYRGHITNYEEYANYRGADIIYQTHESYLIPQTVQFVWNETERKYVYTQTFTYYLKDVEGNVISTKQDGQDGITAKCLLAYATEEEDVTYVWNDGENKYVYTQTLTYYLKDAGEFVSTKQDGQDEITGWLLVNTDGTYQCSEGKYALYDFLGEWSPITYYWCTWTDEYGNDASGYVTGVSGNENAITKLSEAPNSGNILDSEILYNNNGNKLYSITLHNYNYKDNYKVFRYDNKAVCGNVSMVAVYAPAQMRKVYYYTWKDSGSTSSGYVERTTISNDEYILSVKHTASVSGVVTKTMTRGYNSIKYWELGTNDKYYRVGFSGFSSFDATGNPTVMSALEFLMQFVNSSNFDDYPTDVGGAISLSYKQLIDIINSLGYVVSGSDDVVTNAVKVYKALLKKTDSYKAYKYLQNSEVALNLGLNITQEDIDNNYQILYLSAISLGKTLKKEDLNNLNNMATFITLYNKVCGDLTEDTIREFVNNGETSLNGFAGEIIEALSAEQLAVVLDKISMDYFGYVLINPSPNIGYWPSGTYLAGWYMVPEPLRQALIIEGSAVLTFDSDNFVEGNLKCYKIVDQEEDPFGNITYTVQYNDATYEVTRFNVFDENQIDILSRVETSVFIFAAYNTNKFEMVEYEYLKDDLGKLLGAQYNNGILQTSVTKDNKTYVWDVERLAYVCVKKNDETITNSDNLGIDIKYAHNKITHPYTGNPYLYAKEDVRYVVLDRDQMEELAKAFEDNTNIPTSLRDIIEEKSLPVYTTLDDAKKAMNAGDTIVAFIYDIVSYEYKQELGASEPKLTPGYGEAIYYFATNCCYKDDNGEYTLCDLVDKLNSVLYD